MKQYKHIQIGYLLIVAFSAAILLVGRFMFVTNFNPAATFSLAAMIVCLALFATLTVEVDDQAIQIRFGIGLIRRSFPLKDVQAYRAVKNPVYYAWGIHMIPGGWIFNVSGLQAIELQMKSGEKYRIGTDDVLGLGSVIEANTQKI